MAFKRLFDKFLGSRGTSATRTGPASTPSGSGGVDHPGVIGVVGISFCGSSVLNLVLDSHSEVYGGGELHKLFHETKIPRCSVCQYDCKRWTKKFLDSVRKEGLYGELSHVFSSPVVVDSSKNIDHFESLVPLNPQCDYRYIVLVKHPIRHLASYVNNKFIVSRDLIEDANNGLLATKHSEELLEYVRSKASGLLKQYQRIESTPVEGLAGRTRDAMVQYESIVHDPAGTLAPVLAHFDLAYEDGMADFVNHEHHPIGGNRGPHYQIEKGLSTSRFTEYRKAYYQNASGLRVDDKYLDAFSPAQLDTIYQMDSYRELCDWLGYAPDPTAEPAGVIEGD